MKKIILKRKSQYDKGVYKIKGGKKGNGLTIWDYEKNGVVADMKSEGYIVYENDGKCEKGSFTFKEVLRKI